MIAHPLADVTSEGPSEAQRQRVRASLGRSARPSGDPSPPGADGVGARYREYYPHLRLRGTPCDPPRVGFIYTLPPRFALLCPSWRCAGNGALQATAEAASQPGERGGRPIRRIRSATPRPRTTTLAITVCSQRAMST